jgi:hypothetical protein
MDRVEFRRLDSLDLILILVLTCAAWTGVYAYYAEPSPVKLVLMAPVCVTFAFAGPAIRSKLIKRRLALLTMTRWTLFIAWIAAAARIVGAVQGFGTIADGSIGQHVVYGFVMCASIVAPIAAFAAYLEISKLKHSTNPALVLFFGMFPLAFALYEIMIGLRGK